MGGMDLPLSARTLPDIAVPQAAAARFRVVAPGDYKTAPLVFASGPIPGANTRPNFPRRRPTSTRSALRRSEDSFVGPSCSPRPPAQRRAAACTASFPRGLLRRAKPQA